MPTENKSMYAIMGILCLSSSSGYDIKKYCDSVLSGFWHENFGHIYPTLKTMLGEGTIEVVQTSGNDHRIVYGITEKGREAFRAWLAEDTQPQTMRSEFMLKLLFSSQLPTRDVIATLARHRAQHEEKMDAYREMQSRLTDSVPEISKERAVYLNAILRRGILASQAVIDWCDETMAALESEKDEPRN